MKKIPTKKQLEFLDWEFGVFFHFGIRAFFPDHVDWDGKEMPPEAFNPTELDCEQWIKMVKDGGAKYAILTTKHHDGFALWPSEYSLYSVKDTPYKNGKGDIVREFVDACRKYDIKVGLYYSPAQWGTRTIDFKDNEAYNQYFIDQIGELLTNYGKIDYLWFDGCGSEGYEYNHQRIIDAIFSMQPEILTFCDPEWTPCVRWCGNEDGYMTMHNPLVVSSTDFSELATETQQLSKAMLLPSECDCRIRNTWFFNADEDSIKTLDELYGMYEMSVGHGSNFLLNISPDDRGLIPDADMKRFGELCDKIKKNFGRKVNYSVPTREGNSYFITHNDFNTEDWVTRPLKERLCNCIEIKEDLTNGQAVNEFKIYAYPPTYTSKRLLVFKGDTIGHKALCKIGAIRASKFEVEVTDADGEFSLSEINAYFTE